VSSKKGTIEILSLFDLYKREANPHRGSSYPFSNSNSLHDILLDNMTPYVHHILVRF